MSQHPVHSTQTESVLGAIGLIAASFMHPLTLAQLSRAAALPANSLNRRFKRVYGMSPMRWVWTFRTLLAAEVACDQRQTPIGEIARRCGFRSQQHFCRRIHALFGDPPTRLREAVATGTLGSPIELLRPELREFAARHRALITLGTGRVRNQIYLDAAKSFH